MMHEKDLSRIIISFFIFKKLQFFNYKNWFDKIGYHFLLKEEYFKKIYLQAF